MKPLQFVLVYFMFLHNIVKITFRVLLHLDYNIDLNAETLTSMQASGLLHTYLTDRSCKKILLPRLKCTECVLQRFHLNKLDEKVTALLKVVIPRERLDDPTLENELVAYNLNLKITNGQNRCYSAVSDYKEEVSDALGEIKHGEYRWLALQTTAEFYAPVDEDVQWTTKNDQGQQDFKNLAVYMDVKIRWEFGSSLNLVGVTSSHLYGNPKEMLAQFKATIMSKVFEKDVDYPERWYLGISGIIDMLNPYRLCERNFRVPVFSDQLFKIQLQVDHTPADGPQDAHACYVFKKLLFTASSTVGLKDPPRFTCFVRNIEQRGINKLDVELSIHINRNFLQIQDDANLHLREFLAPPNNRLEIVISHFTTMPTYDASDNVLDSSYFVIIVESRLLFGIPPEQYIIETANDIEGKNRAQAGLFCGKLQEMLRLSRGEIYCDDPLVVILGAKPFFKLTVHIRKSTVYWKESPATWNVPMKIALTLNSQTSTNPFNVRWREHHKYTDETF